MSYEQDPGQPSDRPDDLGDAGGRFWDHITATFELDAGEFELLIRACRVLDTLEWLDRKASIGNLSAAREARQQSLTLGRLIGSLNLTDTDGVVRGNAKRQQQSKAGKASWAANVRRLHGS